MFGKCRDDVTLVVFVCFFGIYMYMQLEQFCVSVSVCLSVFPAVCF